MRLTSILACAVFAPVLIAAAQPLRLQPSSPWDVDYGAESCRLIRIFGEGKDRTTLAFQSTAPDQMDMLVIGHSVASYESEVPARFLPVGVKTSDGHVAETTGDRQPAILWSSIRLLPDSLYDSLQERDHWLTTHPGVRPPAASSAERDQIKQAQKDFATAATELEIRSRPNRSVILETGSMGPALARFRECGRDSLKGWGIDPDVEDKIVRPVWSVNPSGWLSASDYPRDMLNMGKQSEVTVRLLIDAAGKVTKCTSLSHFNEPAFNKITCEKIEQRARFQPAELADGTKVPSYMIRNVVFRIAQ